MIVKVLLSLSILFGIGAGVLGYLNKGKVDAMKVSLEDTTVQLNSTKDSLTKTTKTLDETKATLTQATTELEAKKEEAIRLASDLKSAKDNVESLTASVNAKSKEIEELTVKLEEEKKKLANGTIGGGDVPAADGNKVKELEAQLQAAEAEKALFAEQLKSEKARADALAQAEQQRKDQVMRRGLQGRVLAVNPAWNFVVLNLGDRQGVVENGEMVVRRGGAMIARIKITSVEPATSIGDIIPSSVARGVQVQPGDVVVYPGG